MPPFRFRLARVLDWYRKRSRLEEDRVRIALADLARTQAEVQQLLESRRAIERGVSDLAYVQAQELVALDGYRERSRREELALEETRKRLESSLAELRNRLKGLQTRIRLLEKLGERRLADYTIAADRELEELAADAFRSAAFRAGSGAPTESPDPDLNTRG